MYYDDDVIEKREMSGACSTYGWEICRFSTKHGGRSSLWGSKFKY